MSQMDERDRQLAMLIRQEIAKVEDHKERCGYHPGSLEESCIRFEIIGLRKALAFVDPRPHS